MPAPTSARVWALLVAALVVLLLLTSAAVGISRTRESQAGLESLQARSDSASLLERARGDFLNATGSLAAIAITQDANRFTGFQFYMLAAAEDLSSAHRIIVDQGRTADALRTEAILADVQAFRESSSKSARAYLGGDTAVLQESQAEIARLAEEIVAGLTTAAGQERAAVADKKSALEDSFNRTLFITIALGVAGLTIAGIAMTTLVWVVIRPLAGLRLSARAVAAGDLDRRARLVGPSEVRSLASDFNQMTETLLARNRDLEGARAQLQTLNHSLESRVEERTESLLRLTKELKAEIEDRRAAQERIRHLAYHDSLSGLPNRTLFIDRLKQAIAGIRRSGKMVAVIFLDLDLSKTSTTLSGMPKVTVCLRRSPSGSGRCSATATPWLGSAATNSFSFCLISPTRMKPPPPLRGYLRLCESPGR